MMCEMGVSENDRFLFLDQRGAFLNASRSYAEQEPFGQFFELTNANETMMKSSSIFDNAGAINKISKRNNCLWPVINKNNRGFVAYNVAFDEPAPTEAHSLALFPFFPKKLRNVSSDNTFTISCNEFDASFFLFKNEVFIEADYCVYIVYNQK